MQGVTRRTIVLGAGAALGSVMLAGRVSAQVADARPPTVDITNVHEVADGVFVIGDHRIWLVPNIGIVLGRDAALVIDTGLGPANGERVFDLARRLAGSRRLILTLTHFHPEHGYGAQVFQPDATIVYNRAQRDELAEKGARYIDLFRKTQSAAAGALDGTRIVMPHTVYDGARTKIDLGGRMVHLQTVGTTHTGSDQIVFLPAERILFAGDLIEERMFPIFPWFPPDDTDVDGVHWQEVLRDFQRFNPTLIIPGHGDPGPIDIALNLAAQIEMTGRQVQALRLKGLSTNDIVRDLKPKIIAANPIWEHMGLIDCELAYFAAQPA